MTSTTSTTTAPATLRSIGRRIGSGRLTAAAIAVSLLVLAGHDARHAVMALLGTLGFLAAGCAFLLRWRVTGNETTGQLGVGLLLVGLHRPATTVTHAVLDDRWPAVGSTIGIAVCAVAAVAVLRAFPGAGTRRRPTALALLGATLAGSAVMGLGSVLPALARPGLAAACLAMSLLWGATAVAAWRSDQLSSGHRRAAQELAAIAGILSALTALAMVPAAFPAAALTVRTVTDLAYVAAAVVAVLSALRRLTDALAGQERYVAGLLEQLAGHERQLQQARACLHDARAAVAGVRAAGSAIRHVAGPARTELEDSMSAELARVERLLRLPDRAPRVSSVDLDRLVRPQVVSHRERGLRVRWNPTGAAPVRLDGDALAVIVGNLLGNALIHAPGAQCSVTVEVGERLTVTVADDGPGLPAARRAAAFEAGERGTASPGEGLGLAISRDLARRHGGDLVAVDAPVGCRFVLTLPVTAAETAAAPAPARIPRPRPAADAAVLPLTPALP
ncbi:sensor histidine kinase [Trujillonella endophytica]|uniref:histidine kinase n=1 Tax=Trujillonella endophytica TaxID=673521 RepID=A0A1H8PH63_9ACTN|nr:ATP-binding protein [Trujillella endophytica]SEO41339.1 Signal transduction histidine kinase [Trujillella endophytica]